MTGPILSRLNANHPVIAAVVQGIAQAAVNNNTALRPEDVPAVAAAVATAVASSPVAQNSMNAEPLTQSRTFMASVGAVVTGIGAIATQLGPVFSTYSTDKGQFWLSLATVIFGVGATGGGAFGMFGRAVNNLPPMPFRWINPLSWLSKRPA